MQTFKISGHRNSAEQVRELTDIDVSEVLVGDVSIEWATNELWDGPTNIINGKLTLSETMCESQFAIHRIGPST